MFHAISSYIPLEKKLKRSNFPVNREVLKILCLPEFSPFTKCFLGGRNYYNFIVHYSLMEKLEDEIRYKREEKKEDMRRELLGYEDINKRLESVKKRYKESFMREMELLFRKVFSYSVEKANFEMIKSLMEKYGKYVALIEEISVRGKDEEVMKYIKIKGLDKQIKIKDKKPKI